MKLDFSKKLKIFLISILVLLVVGMTMLGVLGFNQTIDNKASYEMQISVDQVVGESVDVLKTSSEKALSDLGIKSDCFAQELNEGSVLIYKFNKDVSDKASDIESAVQTALDASSVSGVKAEVEVYENLGNFYAQTGMAVLAMGIAVVVIFVYALIMNRLAGGVAVLCSSILSVLLFTALMAITRIPAQPFFAILAGATAIISSAIALAVTARYRALVKGENKANSFEIVEGVNKAFRSVYLAIFLGLILTAIISGAIGGLNSIFLGLTVLVAGISGFASAKYMTPFMWSLIKGKKK